MSKLTKIKNCLREGRARKGLQAYGGRSSSEGDYFYEI